MQAKGSDRRNITFSVVIPTYNTGKLIRHAIDSVLSQTTPAQQLIIADDGSTDNTAQVVSSYKDPRIEYIRKPHSGSVPTRNFATPHVTGTYLAYLDADDHWDPRRIQRLQETAEKMDNPAFMFSDFHRLNIETSELLPKNSEINPQILNLYTEKTGTDTTPLYIYSSQDALRLIGVTGYPMYPSAFAVRTDVLRNIGGWDTQWKRCADFDFCLRIAKEHTFIYIDEDLTTVGRHEDHGDPRAYILRQNKWDVAILKHHWEHSSESPLFSGLLLKGYKNRLAGLAWHYRKSGQHKEADSYYRDLSTLPGEKLRGSYYRLINQLSRVTGWATQIPRESDIKKPHQSDA